MNEGEIVVFIYKREFKIPDELRDDREVGFDLYVLLNRIYSFCKEYIVQVFKDEVLGAHIMNLKYYILGIIETPHTIGIIKP